MTKREAKRLAVAIIGNECLVQDSFLDCLPDDEATLVREGMYELGDELFSRAGLNGDHLFGTIAEIREVLGI